MKQNGDCYEAHANYMLKLKSTAGFTLCHGTVTGQGPIEGIKHDHCWLELPDMVVDISNGKNILMPKSRYYKIGKIDPSSIKRYTLKQLRKQILYYKHYGPWEARL